MSIVNFATKFVPSMAERLKFVPIDLSALQTLGYPTTSDYGAPDGRFAVLTYSMNPTTISLSGSTINANVCSVGVNNWDALINETYSGTALSANVSVSNWPTILTVSGTVSTIALAANRTYIASGTYGATAVPVTGLNLSLLEIFNASGNTAYVLLSATSDFDDLSSVGIPITPSAFYSIEREISEFTLGADDANSDLRVIGHYRV